MPRPRERVYTLDKQKKHLARLSLLSAKRFRFNILISLEARPVRGDDDDLLGLFTGWTYGEKLDESDPMPPSVRLFIENRRLEAADDPRRFRKEVRTTLPHGIGHDLGLDEDGLDALGIG